MHPMEKLRKSTSSISANLSELASIKSLIFLGALAEAFGGDIHAALADKKPEFTCKEGQTYVGGECEINPLGSGRDSQILELTDQPGSTYTEKVFRRKRDRHRRPLAERDYTNIIVRPNLKSLVERHSKAVRDKVLLECADGFRASKPRGFASQPSTGIFPGEIEEVTSPTSRRRYSVVFNVPPAKSMGGKQWFIPISCKGKPFFAGDGQIREEIIPTQSLSIGITDMVADRNIHPHHKGKSKASHKGTAHPSVSHHSSAKYKKPHGGKKRP